MDSIAKAQGASTIFVAGAANLDILGQADTPLAAADSTPGTVRFCRGGVARNIAENLARLGHAVHLISAVGCDEFGQRMLQETESAGVNVATVHRLSGRRTATYLSLSGPDGALSMAVNDMRLFELVTPALLETHRVLLKTATTLVLDCNLNEETLGWLTAVAPQAWVFADGVSAVKSVRLRKWLGKIHTLKINRLEAEALTGQQIQNLEQAGVATLLLQAAGVRETVISLGDQGVCWRAEDGVFRHRAARQIQVLNTNGSGDALLAGLVDGHLKGMPLSQAVAWGATCAEMTLSSHAANAAELSAYALEQRLQSRAESMWP